ncbi:hypothetical protein EVAR_95087_1 [Eumeta japonica]|uniref:Uncharacterized protein n=1 Tax=Eumeta variegata TaxID=151549 RepID=A0A4C1W903_EUMVA|nr:hypothetical protein EVAR_95087_1 [Eumeta japonica]
MAETVKRSRRPRSATALYDNLPNINVSRRAPRAGRRHARPPAPHHNDAIIGRPPARRERSSRRAALVSHRRSDFSDPSIRTVNHHLARRRRKVYLVVGVQEAFDRQFIRS